MKGLTSEGTITAFSWSQWINRLPDWAFGHTINLVEGMGTIDNVVAWSTCDMAVPSV